MGKRQDFGLLAARLGRFARVLATADSGRFGAADALAPAVARALADIAVASDSPETAGPDRECRAYRAILDAARSDQRAAPPRHAPPSAAVSFGATSFAAELHAHDGDRHASDAGERLPHALALLPPEEREALLLVVLEGFGYARAAQILDIPQPVLVARLARARELMPKRMPERAAARRTKSPPAHLRVIK